MNGEIVYLFIYDSGIRFTDEQLKGLLKNPEDFSKYEYNRPTPEEIPALNVPFIFNLKDEILMLENIQYKFRTQVSLYVTGQFVIRVRYSSGDIHPALSKMTYNHVITSFIDSVALKAKNRVEISLSKICDIHINELTEAYRFYYMEGEKSTALKQYKKNITGLLIDEPSTATLDEKYVDEILSRNISYNSDDIHFVGWESAVLVDKLTNYEHELLIAEIANVQLLEMRIIHKNILEKLASSNKTIGALTKLDFLKRRYGYNLGSLNKDLGEFYETTKELTNIITDTPFGLGEWYLSKLYVYIADF